MSIFNEFILFIFDCNSFYLSSYHIIDTVSLYASWDRYGIIAAARKRWKVITGQTNTFYTEEKKETQHQVSVDFKDTK